MLAEPPIRFLVDENVPAGVTTFLRSRGQFERGAGRISLALEGPKALGRIRELIETIEFLYWQANRSGNRFVLQISATSMTVVG